MEIVLAFQFQIKMPEESKHDSIISSDSQNEKLCNYYFFDLDCLG